MSNKKELTPEQERKINEACRKYQRSIQRMVDRKNSGLTKITISTDDQTVTIAERKEK